MRDSISVDFKTRQNYPVVLLSKEKGAMMGRGTRRASEVLVMSISGPGGGDMEAFILQ